MKPEFALWSSHEQPISNHALRRWAVGVAEGLSLLARAVPSEGLASPRALRRALEHSGCEMGQWVPKGRSFPGF